MPRLDYTYEHETDETTTVYHLSVSCQIRLAVGAIHQGDCEELLDVDDIVPEVRAVEIHTPYTSWAAPRPRDWQPIFDGLYNDDPNLQARIYTACQENEA